MTEPEQLDPPTSDPAKADLPPTGAGCTACTGCADPDDERRERLGAALVSLQRATAPDAVEGHLTWGALLTPTLVVVPGPLTWIDDDSTPHEVLLASRSPGRTGIVERIRPQKIDVLGLAGEVRDGVAVVRLAQPSRHAPDERLASLPILQAALSAEHPDVWAALLAAGGVPPGIREQPPEPILRSIADFERAQRRNLIQVPVFTDPGLIPIHWCKIFHCSDWVPWL